MARETTWGTPTRTSRYPRLRRERPFVWASVALLASSASLVLALHAVGVRSAVAPGPVSSGHAPIGQRCNECHAEGGGLPRARCERCHDPGGAANLGHSAHVVAGGGSADKAAAQSTLPCERCHGEHKGREAPLAAVSNFQCAQCHFRGFDAHPEFAAVKQRRGERAGIRFDHAAHLGALQELGLSASACTQCHEPSAEAGDFEPIDFERHCAGCHLKEGSLGASAPVPAEDVSLPEGARRADVALEQGRVVLRRNEHKDPWVLANWRALRRQIDPAGFAADRQQLLAREDRLDARLRRLGQAAPGSQPPPAVLTLAVRKQLERAREETRARVEMLYADTGEAPAALDEHSRQRKRASLEMLTSACRVCHTPRDDGAFVEVAAARHVLQGARFSHAPHLLYAECARCHAGVSQSHNAEELHLEGVATCRNCHGAAGVRDDCQRCHRYHPKAAW